MQLKPRIRRGIQAIFRLETGFLFGERLLNQESQPPLSVESVVQFFYLDPAKQGRGVPGF
jgi:hypothetical protein